MNTITNWQNKKMKKKFNPFPGEPDYTGKDYGQEIEAITRRIDDLHYEAIA